MHTGVFIPKIHGISTPFFVKILSMVSQTTFGSIVRPFSQRQWPFKGSPVCHVLIHSKELQSSDSHLLREEVWWLTYLWVRLFLLWKQSSVFSNCVGQNFKLSWGQLFLPVYWQLLCVCWAYAEITMQSEVLSSVTSACHHTNPKPRHPREEHTLCLRILSSFLLCKSFLVKI